MQQNPKKYKLIPEIAFGAGIAFIPRFIMLVWGVTGFMRFSENQQLRILIQFSTYFGAGILLYCITAYSFKTQWHIKKWLNHTVSAVAIGGVNWLYLDSHYTALPGFGFAMSLMAHAWWYHWRSDRKAPSAHS